MTSITARPQLASTPLEGASPIRWGWWALGLVVSFALWGVILSAFGWI